MPRRDQGGQGECPLPSTVFHVSFRGKQDIRLRQQSRILTHALCQCSADGRILPPGNRGGTPKGGRLDLHFFLRLAPPRFPQWPCRRSVPYPCVAGAGVACGPELALGKFPEVDSLSCDAAAQSGWPRLVLGKSPCQGLDSSQLLSRSDRRRAKLEDFQGAQFQPPPLSPVPSEGLTPTGVKSIGGVSLVAESSRKLASSSQLPQRGGMPPSSSTPRVPAVSQDEEQELWDLLVQLRADTNRLMERLLQNKHLKGTTTDGATPPDERQTESHLRQAVGSREAERAIRTRCDGRLTIYVTVRP